ncbi:hypothetical protein [Ruegeria sp. HKCCA5763]|uniref:hypothetical protein n=1 Tax=Ruegeria sp. HKCCA5763 TaxID=2682987 RepID=UPI0014882EC0|nr:hypothetical protein [Ruegeria sp. HKCCA5763]
MSTLAKRLCVPSRLVLFGICCSVFLTSFAKAQEECDAACQAARKAQDPLAAVTALLTDNTIGFGPNSDSTTYNFQLQPVYTFEGEAANVILRGLIPYVGLPVGVAGADASLPEFAFSDSGGGTDFGFSDTIVQAFYVPEVEPGTFKVGYGVQLSFDTAEDGFNGPGNGAGLALVGFNFAGDLSYGGVVGHLWGEDDFSLTTIQPIVFYNLEDFLGGSYVGYTTPVFQTSAGACFLSEISSREDRLAYLRKISSEENPDSLQEFSDQAAVCADQNYISLGSPESNAISEISTPIRHGMGQSVIASLTIPHFASALIDNRREFVIDALKTTAAQLQASVATRMPLPRTPWYQFT